MNILYYSWGENSTKTSVDTLKSMGHKVSFFDMPVSNKLKDEAFEEKLIKKITKENTEAVFTYNFFPCISNAVSRTKAVYISWIYDNPHYTAYEKSVFNSCNRIFHFDGGEVKRLRAAGVEHIYHMPLGVPVSHRVSDTEGLPVDERVSVAKSGTAAEGVLVSNGISVTGRSEYDYDVSFVGSLYNGSTNLYDSINYLPPYEKGFFESIINSQRMIWGVDFAGELITDEVYAKVSPYLAIDMGEDFFITPKEIFINILQKKITSVERIDLLKRAGDRFDVTLFSADEDDSLGNIKKLGYVDHDTKLPEIYMTSKINLNITLRSITSGIPLRCMEVMNCGGFLLTNYQPELAEYFTDGEDLVMFTSPEDMLEKIGFYLLHEEERVAIANRGRRKVGELFSLEQSFEKIFSTVV